LCLVVVGAQWGDEGKGKIVDLLAERFAWIARYQGGHNAGHTVVAGEQRFILQLIPCGILRPGCRAAIGNGVVVDPQALVDEIETLERAGVKVAGHLFVSWRAQVILPYHRMIELAAENAPGRVKIGTTTRGIGPAYEDKMGRRGLRIADLADADLLRAHIENAMAEKNAIAGALYGTAAVDAGKMFETYRELSRRILPYAADVSLLLNRAADAGEPILLEGAQGTLLDIDHGTYPFVTSSSTISGGACIGAGLAPTRIGGVLGVTKAYATRVGGGPFPSEENGASGDMLRERGREFGSVTGRPRRVGWLDLPLLRYAIQLNGIDSLLVTKLDVLDTLKEIPVCTGYRLDGKPVEEIPARAADWERLEPVYEVRPGWGTPTAGMRRLEDLPRAAREYLDFVAAQCGTEIGLISTGPERNESIIVPGSQLDRCWRGASSAT
jgi:adenylosuccinate synthase